MASPNPPPQSPATATAATSQRPQPQQSAPEKPPYQNPFIHNVALGVTPIALGALFLPPRKLDLRQVILGGVALWGTNQLVHDYSGRSFAQRFGARMEQLSGTRLPERAQRTQMLLRAEREKRRREGEQARTTEPGLSEADRGMLEEQKKERGRSRAERGPLEALWMGDQDDDWKEKRDRREKEALSEGGGGYWGLITDQIAEVWNGAKKKEQEAQAAEADAKAKAAVEEGRKA
ncbi:hypothetical protein DL766_001606 [Monosporascus sp. MC13-8B]|uniref:Rhomboid family membrane protein n=1 Tax=Monosporascus cannonballus TaxID=155416 RepID=A0ABY0HIV6_9PEZI|nr:hypothetical protein DL763_006607 [Monosporascus cannonballus]RYO94462.1 hypothetical protein DL762_000558 [Monosporascus cannonballus]RYP37296.1 hypothetical protein DL766_001606 [Monosporascus sp. MC13-8B]